MWSSKWKGAHQDLSSPQYKSHPHLLSLLSKSSAGKHVDGGGRRDRQASRGGVGWKRVTGKINETPLKLIG